MYSEIAISVQDVSKSYNMYEKPQDRLKQMLWGRKKKYFDEFWALSDVNFEVRKGETVGIVGRNGSGKSTLLQIICGTVTPTTGHVIRNGRISALLELGSGFNPEFTGRENVYMNGALLGLSHSQMEERFDEIAAFADIGDFIDSAVKHYSSGMFARLAFAVAIHVDPEILIVDEILAVGDAAFQRRCLEKFYEVRDNGCSILFVSHDQYQVKSICDRALYLNKGKQILFGAAGRVIDRYTIDMEATAAEARNREKKAHDARVQHSADSVISDVHEKNPPSLENAVLETRQEEVISPSEKVTSPDEIFKITDVKLQDELGNTLTEVECGKTIELSLGFKAMTNDIPENITFVFNLYRHDDVYLCGTTTTMDGIAPLKSGHTGKVKITFPKFPLLSGLYKWRVAINDSGGFVVLAEAKNVCEFQVIDGFEAVGMFNLERSWAFDINN